MRTTKDSVRMVVIIAAALLLAMLLGVLVTRVNAADGDMVLWKQHCPAYADVILVPAADWGGVHVLCVRGALEEAPGGRK